MVGSFEVDSQAAAVLVAFLVGWWMRGREVKPLGYDRVHPGQVWVGGLLGAMVGACTCFGFGPTP